MSESSGRNVEAGQGWTWVADGFGLFKKAPGVWIALVVLLAVILFAILLVFAWVPLLGRIATFLLLPVLMGGLMLGCRRLHGGGELEIGQLFEGFKVPQTSNLVVLGALSLVALVVVMVPVVAILGAGVVFGGQLSDASSLVAIGSSVLLAVLVATLLVIPISMAFWFAPALVVLRGSAPVAALKDSFQACLKNFVPFLIYSIVMLVLSIVAMIPLGLGWLILGPVAIASVYVSYLDIYGNA